MLRNTEATSPSGEFGEIGDEIRCYSGELESELEKKRRECRLAREQALLRLSEMEKETFRRVEEEWQSREHDLALLSSGLEKELELIRQDVSGRVSGGSALKALMEDTFAAVLGEKEP
jgi:hypothetical protein